MNNLLTFVIPVRHPDNADSWSLLKKNLAQTIASISAQDHNGWQAIIVANIGSDLPPLPANFSVEYVDYPPNPAFKQGNNELEVFRDAVRMDKGRRLLAGVMKAASNSKYIMLVDDDDFVSRKLVSFVAAHTDANGWYIDKGYVWGDGGKLVYLYSNFSMLCGSSHIIRTDLFQLPESITAVTPEYIRTMLGSHIFISKQLAANGTALAPLPFIGAIYRIGHVGTHSRSQGLWRSFFIKRDLLFRPFELLSRFKRLRPINDQIRNEFWGAQR